MTGTPWCTTWFWGRAPWKRHNETMNFARWLRRLFAAPSIEGDVGNARLAQTLHVVAMAFAAFAFVVFLGNILGGLKFNLTVFSINAIAFVSMLPVKYWLRRGYLGFVQSWLLGVMFICITVVVAYIGTVRAPITGIYLAGVVIAGLLFERKGIYYATALCSLAVGGLIMAENAGLLPQPDYAVGITQWVTYTALFGFTGSLIYALNQLTREALSRAELELVQRKRTEAALNAANQKLNQRVQEVESLQKELHEQALRDGLTGLYNRRYMADALDREMVRVRRENSSMCFVMVDVDYFKRVNDEYGHQAGDAVLQRLAQLLTGHARGSDIVCRYGGEEFLLLFPGINLDYAAKRAEEIRQKAAEVGDPRVTLSIGIASYPEHGKDWEEVVSKADKALYQSKEAGRNRVTVWGIGS